MKLLELFNSPVEAKWKKPLPRRNDAVFSVGGQNYLLGIDTTVSNGQKAWYVEFGIQRGNEMQYDNSGTGNELAVYSSVLQLIKQHMEKYGVRPLTMSTADAGRNSLYQRMIRRMLPNWTITADAKTITASPPGTAS